MHHHKNRSWPLALVFLITGLALIVCIFTGISLPLILVLFISFAAIGGSLIYKRLGPSEKKSLRSRLTAGLFGGFLATIAYDLSRYVIYLLFPLHVWPFEAIPLFGQLLIGDHFSNSWILIFGILYHVINGITFGIAYSILFARRGIVAGISWALVLEALMLPIYPGWLGIEFFEEFASISVIGHLAYGCVLGVYCRRYVLKWIRP